MKHLQKHSALIKKKLQGCCYLKPNNKSLALDEDLCIYEYSTSL